MRQKSGSQAASSEQVVKDIRWATRKQYSAEEKIRVVLDGLRGEYSIAELCRREGIAESLYYSWSKELNSPEFSRHPRLSFSAAVRTRRVTASRSWHACVWVVEHLDVVEHILPGIVTGFVGPAPYPLPLEQVEEALGDGVVMAVARAGSSSVPDCEPSGMTPSPCW